ncbi:hypothetical protein BB560_000139, partial [Smittium megazygosporum]
MDSKINKAVDLVQSEGVAHIKAEFIIKCDPSKNTASSDESDAENRNGKKRKNKRGQNKDREKTMRIEKVPDSEKLCISLSTGVECPSGEKCPFGIRCRAGMSHMIDGKQIINEKLVEENITNVFNGITREHRESLRAKDVKFPRTLEAKKTIESKKRQVKDLIEGVSPDQNKYSSSAIFEDQEKVKNKVDFKGKTYLAPLTTVGNLPFRRICKEFGVDITCSEMILCDNILNGYNTDWALTKRHSSEDIFGIQLCGNNFDQIVQTTEVLNNFCKVDFIDLNVGCPIESVFKKGSGSGMLRSKKRLFSILEGMNLVSKVPITVKYRTGIGNGENTGLELSLKLQEIGIPLGTIHGRSRTQRYSKLADWDYIKSVKESVPQLNIFGNGDVFSWEDYWNKIEETKVDGIMIGRGALIKPWIFKEINERKVWDISSRERLDILKKYCNYGLEHWGTDEM